MTKVYEIREFSLVGKTLYTFQKREDLVFDVTVNKFKSANGLVEPQNRHYSLTTDLTQYSAEELFSAENETLPYKAVVTQDLPYSVSKRVKPEVYENCLLMAEKHGGCLQFKNLDNGEILRIAINSNMYSPV
jgi:hypothetical protein